MLRFEVHAWQGNPQLDAAMQLEELDLKVGGRPEIGLLILQSPQLHDFAGFGAGRLGWAFHRVILARPEAGKGVRWYKSTGPAADADRARAVRKLRSP